jgi:hypothetical protein
LATDALITLHSLLKNMLQAVYHKLQEDSGADGFDLLIWLEKPRNHMGQDLDCMADVLMGIMAVPIRTSAPCNFCAFPTISRGQNHLLHYPETSGKWYAKHFQEMGGVL